MTVPSCLEGEAPRAGETPRKGEAPLTDICLGACIDDTPEPLHNEDVLTGFACEAGMRRCVDTVRTVGVT